MNAALLSSDDQTWNTPRWFIDRIEKALGRIALDPCSNSWSEVRAAREFRLERGKDGLSLPWRGLTYVNPPYGRAIAVWTARCADQAGEGAEVIALVPSRTDTAWWQAAARSCQAVVLWRGRFKFMTQGKEADPAPFPSSVFYFGQRGDLFLAEFGNDGIVVMGGGR